MKYRTKTRAEEICHTRRSPRRIPPQVTPASTARVVVSNHEDMNPLKPCGACAEWLRKITEVNPNFKVVTFTDAHCHGVYVEPVAGSG